MLDFLAVGAVAVQVGTAIFADPTLPVRLVDELAAECRRGRGRRTRHRDGLPRAGAVGQGRRVPAVAGAAVGQEVSGTVRQPSRDDGRRTTVASPVAIIDARRDPDAGASRARDLRVELYP